MPSHEGLQQVAGGITTLAVIGSLILAASVFAAEPPTQGSTGPVLMTVASGSDPLTQTDSQQLANGLVQTSWVDANGNVTTATGPQGSTVAVSGTTASITPPQAAVSSAVDPGGSLVAAPAVLSPPPDHSYFNALSISDCASGTCVYGSSVQYSLQEIPGEVYMMQKTTGTVSTNNGSCEAEGRAWNRFLNETGDSGPLDYSPSADSPTGGGTVDVSFDAFGFGLGFPVSRTTGWFGPAAPSGWGEPAFGSRWVPAGNCSTKNQGLGSLDDIHIGHGQSDWDSLYISY